MNTYDKIYGALLKLCKNEGLELKEANLYDKELIAVWKGRIIIINSELKGK